MFNNKSISDSFERVWVSIKAKTLLRSNKYKGIKIIFLHQTAETEHEETPHTLVWFRPPTDSDLSLVLLDLSCYLRNWEHGGEGACTSEPQKLWKNPWLRTGNLRMPIPKGAAASHNIPLSGKICSFEESVCEVLPSPPSTNVYSFISLNMPTYARTPLAKIMTSVYRFLHFKSYCLKYHWK